METQSFVNEYRSNEGTRPCGVPMFTKILLETIQLIVTACDRCKQRSRSQ